MNEYLNLFKKIMNMNLVGYEEVGWRENLTMKYSWAVPNEKAILTISKYSPIIEIGAGTGYWAMLLKNQGIDLVAYDLYPFKDNLYHNLIQWFPVEKGTPKDLKCHPQRNLFLCWPPYKDNMAFECLRWFKGKIFIYIGEKIEGCSATKDFFENLIRDFKLIEKIKIPQWWRIHDNLTIWERKN